MHFIIADYIEGKISLSKASELLGMTRIELQRKLKERGIPIRSLSEEDAFAEVEALRIASYVRPKGIADVLEKFSRKVDKDVLKEFLEERR